MIICYTWIGDICHRKWNILRSKMYLHNIDYSNIWIFWINIDVARPPPSMLCLCFSARLECYAGILDSKAIIWKYYVSIKGKKNVMSSISTSASKSFLSKNWFILFYRKCSIRIWSLMVWWHGDMILLILS